MRLFRKSVVGIAAALSCFSAMSCQSSGAVNGAVDAGPVYLAPDNLTTTISGAVWDPEAYFWALATCGGSCPFPPIVVPGTPLFERSTVANATVGLFDPKTTSIVAGAPPTGPFGTYELDHVTSRTDVPFFETSVVSVPDGGSALKSFGPPATPVPPGNYLPTFTLQPIVTKWAQCLLELALATTDNGALQAVAGAMTAAGTPTTVADLLNPAKHGGVILWWLYLPQFAPVRVPAFGTATTADVGTTYYIGWAPPGVLPPFLHQSARGYFVVPSATSSPIGYSVTVLPPSSAPVTWVNFTLTDPVTDPSSGRPWRWAPLPPIPVAPGVATFGQYQALPQTTNFKIPSWLCLPGP